MYIFYISDAKTTTNTKNSGPKNDSEKSSFEFPSSSPEENEEIDFDLAALKRDCLEN